MSKLLSLATAIVGILGTIFFACYSLRAIGVSAFIAIAYAFCAFLTSALAKWSIKEIKEED